MTKLISFKLDRALLLRLDGAASNRSDFIREAVEEKLRRTTKTGQSAWDALGETEGLDVSVRRARGKVKHMDL